MNLKSRIKISMLHFVFVTLIFSSCSKNKPEATVPVNKPPVAKAGSDILIILPHDSVMLDGSASFDPDWHETN